MNFFKRNTDTRMSEECKKKTGIKILKEEADSRLNFLAGFICHSNAIAGLESHYRFLIREIMVQKQDGHVGALLFLEELAKDKQHIFDEFDLKKVHRLISGDRDVKTSDLFPNLKGEYRMNVNFYSINEKKYPHFLEVPSLTMQHLMEFRAFQSKIEGFSEMEKVKTCADLYFDLMDILPFENCNGQVARAVAFYLLTFAGVKPFIFSCHDCHIAYFQAIHSKSREMIRNYFYQKAAVKL